MLNRLPRLVIVTFAALLPSTIDAAVALPPVFGDHMVLQRGMSVPVWGSAASGEKVTIKYATQTVEAIADDKGDWTAKLAPLSKGDAASMTITGDKSDKPIVFLGMGTPDLVSLMKRLPGDKVPMIMGTAMVGPLWTANGWHFSFRPTYSQEFAGLFSYLQGRLPEKRALRIGTVSTQGIPGYVDQVNGVVKLAQTYPDRFVVANSQWVDNTPINVTSQVRELLAAKPDLILVGTNTAQVVATVKAIKELGAKVPVVTSSHNGLTEVAKAVPLADLEGSYSVFAFAPSMDPSVTAAQTFEKYNKTKCTWGLTAAQTAAQALLATAAIERAIATVGPTKLTGQAVYDALEGPAFGPEHFQGLLKSVAFTKEAPFPTANLSVKAVTVKDGKLVPVTADWMVVPELPKW